MRMGPSRGRAASSPRARVLRELRHKKFRGLFKTWAHSRGERGGYSAHSSAKKWSEHKVFQIVVLLGKTFMNSARIGTPTSVTGNLEDNPPYVGGCGSAGGHIIHRLCLLRDTAGMTCLSYLHPAPPPQLLNKLKGV